MDEIASNDWSMRKLKLGMVSCMVAELLNCPIHFGLVIVSCDCHILRKKCEQNQESLFYFPPQPPNSIVIIAIHSCLSFITVPSKRQREQRNAARAASVEFFKKRRLETSSVHDSLQPCVDNDKPDTTDTTLTDTIDEEETTFIEKVPLYGSSYWKARTA